MWYLLPATATDRYSVSAK